MQAAAASQQAYETASSDPAATLQSLDAAAQAASQAVQAGANLTIAASAAAAAAQAVQTAQQPPEGSTNSWVAPPLLAVEAAGEAAGRAVVDGADAQTAKSAGQAASQAATVASQELYSTPESIRAAGLAAGGVIANGGTAEEAAEAGMAAAARAIYKAPWGGNLSVSPSTGSAWSTPFVATCQHWTAFTPILGYRFVYVRHDGSGESREVIGVPTQTNSQATLELPEGDVTVRCDAVVYEGIFASAEVNVTVGSNPVLEADPAGYVEALTANELQDAAQSNDTVKVLQLTHRILEVLTEKIVEPTGNGEATANGDNQALEDKVQNQVLDALTTVMWSNVKLLCCHDVLYCPPVRV